MEVSNSVGLTAKGNEYTKSQTGKKAGLFVGGIIPTVASLLQLSNIKDELNLRNSQKAIKDAVENGVKNAPKNMSHKIKNLVEVAPEKLLTTKNIKSGAIALCAIAASTIVSGLLGNLYDKCVNKERMAEADGRAELGNTLE